MVNLNFFSNFYVHALGGKNLFINWIIQKSEFVQIDSAVITRIIYNWLQSKRLLGICLGLIPSLHFYQVIVDSFLVTFWRYETFYFVRNAPSSFTKCSITRLDADFGLPRVQMQVRSCGYHGVIYRNFIYYTMVVTVGSSMALSNFYVTIEDPRLLFYY